MDDFFKSIRDQLENRQKPEFREEAWTALSENLDAMGSPSGNVSRKYWGTAALLLLLLGSTFCNYWFYRQLKSPVAVTAKETIIYQTDTIHHTRHIYHTDTIHHTRLVYAQSVAQTQNASTAFLAKLRSFDFYNVDQRIATDYTPLFASTSRNSLFSQSSSDAPFRGEDDQSSLLNRFTLFYGLPQAVAELESPERKTPEAEVGLIAREQRKKSFGQQILYGMKPKKVYLGPILGGVYPVHSNLNHQRGIALGLQTAVSFSDNLRLWVDASYLRLTYTTSQIQSLRGVPPITPPDDNFTFVSASVPQPALQYSAGLQYTFSNSGKWNPYAAVGLSTLTLFPFEVTYKFEDSVNDLNLIIKQGVDRKTQFSQHLLFKFGLDNKLSDHWSLQIESLYRLSLDTEGATNSNLFGLRFGTMYRF